MKVQFNPQFPLATPGTTHHITKKLSEKDSKIQALFTNAANQTLEEALREIHKDIYAKELWERMEKRFGEIITKCVPPNQAPSGSYFEYVFSIKTFRKVAHVSNLVIGIANHLSMVRMKSEIAGVLRCLAFTDSEVDLRMVAEQIFQYDCGNRPELSEWHQNRQIHHILDKNDKDIQNTKGAKKKDKGNVNSYDPYNLNRKSTQKRIRKSIKS